MKFRKFRQMNISFFAEDASGSQAVENAGELPELEQQEKAIKERLYANELAEVDDKCKFEREEAANSARNTLEFENAKQKEAVRSLEYEGELARRQSSFDETLREKKADIAAEQDAAERWIELQVKKQKAMLGVEQERMCAYSKYDSKVLAAAIEDLNRGERISKIAELELMHSISPELLLAVAAARGIPEAKNAVSTLKEDLLASIESIKTEQKELFEKLYTMSEQGFARLAQTTIAEK